MKLGQVKSVAQVVKLREETSKEKVQLDFSWIFESYYKRLYNYFYYRVHNETLTEDLVSQTFEKVMVNLYKYEPEKGQFEVWLFTIARNQMNDYFRKQKRHPWTSLDEVFQEIAKEGNPEALMMMEESSRQLIRAVQYLKDKERTLIAYRFGADLKNKEIAVLMGMSERHVATLLHRTLKKLKKYLEEEEMK